MFFYIKKKKNSNIFIHVDLYIFVLIVYKEKCQNILAQSL